MELILILALCTSYQEGRYLCECDLCGDGFRAVILRWKIVCTWRFDCFRYHKHTLTHTDTHTNTCTFTHTHTHTHTAILLFIGARGSVPRTATTTPIVHVLFMIPLYSVHTILSYYNYQIHVNYFASSTCILRTKSNISTHKNGIAK